MRIFPRLYQIYCPQNVSVQERVISTMKDRNASGTMVMKKTGTMDSGVMQTSRPVQTPRTIQHLNPRMFQAMELAKMLVSQKPQLR